MSDKIKPGTKTKIDAQQILKEILKNIVLAPNSRRLFVIGLTGLPGSGKSFLAKKLGEELHLPILSNDQIRRDFNRLGLPGSSPHQELLQEIAETRTEILLENKVSHIIDADLYMFYEEAKTRSERYGGELLMIRINAEEKTMLERIEARKKEASTLSQADADTYFQRKELYESNPKQIEYYFQVITNYSLQVEQSIQDISSKLKQDGYF